MTPFDRIDTNAHGQFALTELESTGEPGTYEIDLPIELEATVLALMIEGDLPEAVIEIDGQRIDAEVETHGDGAPSRKLFLRLGAKLKSVRVRIWTKGQRAKVSILRVLREFGADFKKRLSCTGCKRLVRFLVTWILTGMGVPDLPWDGTLPASVWDRLREFLSLDVNKWPGIIAKLLSALHSEFVEKFLKALGWFLAFAKEMYEPFDRMLEAICRYLGFCGPKAEPA